MRAAASAAGRSSSRAWVTTSRHSATVDRVLRREHTAALEAAELDPVELPDAVVPSRQHLEHHVAQRRRGILESPRQEAAERLRALDEDLEARLTICCVGVAPERREVPLDVFVDGLAAPLEYRLQEVAVVHVAREIGHLRRGLFGHARNLLEQVGEVVGGARGELGRTPGPPLEHRLHDHRGIAGPLVAPVQPEQPVLQRRGDLEAVRSEVRERVAQPRHEARGQPGAARLERAQVRQEVLAGAEAGGFVRIVADALPAEERRDVRVDPEDRLLEPEDDHVVGRDALVERAVVVQQPRDVRRRHVGAQHQLAQVGQGVPRTLHVGRREGLREGAKPGDHRARTVRHPVPPPAGEAARPANTTRGADACVSDGSS